MTDSQQVYEMAVGITPLGFELLLVGGVAIGDLMVLVPVRHFVSFETVAKNF